MLSSDRFIIRRSAVVALYLFAATSGCECEDRVRKAVSNSGGRTLPKDPEKPLSSDPREAEPNDARASATPVALDAELRSVLGEFEDEGGCRLVSLHPQRGDVRSA
ncbi:MAG: hypothetical protein AAGI01_14075 [Myxococcota bacterium]